MICKLRKPSALTMQRYHHVCGVRQHVREQYEAVRPIAEALAAAYPDLIRPEHVSLPAFLSAVELHYSHALEARQPSALFLRSEFGSLCFDLIVYNLKPRPPQRENLLDLSHSFSQRCTHVHKYEAATCAVRPPADDIKPHPLLLLCRDPAAMQDCHLQVKCAANDAEWQQVQSL